MQNINASCADVESDDKYPLKMSMHGAALGEALRQRFHLDPTFRMSDSFSRQWLDQRNDVQPSVSEKQVYQFVYRNGDKFAPELAGIDFKTKKRKATVFINNDFSGTEAATKVLERATLIVWTSTRSHM